MNYLFSIFSAIFIASTVVAEPTAAQYFAPKVTTDSGYTQTLMLPDGTLEYVVSFTTVNDETNPYTWQVPANVSKIDYLVVAGGGGGGAGQGGGGGGGGGMVTGEFTSLLSESLLSILVGDGGSGGTRSNCASNGDNSSVKNGNVVLVEAIGGGAGGSGNNAEYIHGSDGGNGGGAAGSISSVVAKDTPINGGKGLQGFDGASKASTIGFTSGYCIGSSGGGASESPSAISKAYNSSSNGGRQVYDGGDGARSYITGKSVYYAGGGGGGSYAGGTYAFNGGNGGGGKGGSARKGYYGGAVKSGVDGTGGGGGGGGNDANSGTIDGLGGNGGSGIVVLRYALNNDNFQGIVVHTTTEKFGNPSPAYDIYKELPSNSVFTCPKYTELSEGARATCIGWELYGWNEEGEEYLIRSETFDTENPPYEETDLSKTITFTRNDSEKGVVLKWKFVKEYYVSTVASCERGSLVADKSGWYRAGDTIQVAITSMDNFIGWGGWGTSADRAFDLSKEITVVAAPMTITAYFTAHDKDNLVLNGDFEMSGNTSDSTTIDTTFSRLIGGIWESTQTTYSAYPTGLLSARSTGVANSGSKVISGNHSGIIGTIGKNSNHSGTASISCYVNIPCSGLYDLSFDVDPGNVNATTWEISVYLQKNGSDEEVNVCNILQKDNASKANYPFEIQIRKGGIYKLIFKIERSKVYKNDVNDNVNAHSALDNLMLKLKKRFGFAIMVR